MKRLYLLIAAFVFCEVLVLVTIPFLQEQVPDHLCWGILFLFLVLAALLGLAFCLIRKAQAVVDASAKQESQRICQKLLSERSGSLKAEREQLIELAKKLESGGSVLALPEESYRRYCAHPLTDAILRHKIPLLKDKGITVKVSAILPEQLALDQTILLSVLMNLLDNAGQAAMQAAQTGSVKGEVGIKIFTKAGYIIFQVENSALKPPKTGCSTKKEPGHGLGLLILQEVCKEKNGRLKIQFDEKKRRVTSEVILPLDDPGRKDLAQ